MKDELVARNFQNSAKECLTTKMHCDLRELQMKLAEEERDRSDAKLRRKGIEDDDDENERTHYLTKVTENGYEIEFSYTSGFSSSRTIIRKNQQDEPVRLF